MTKDFNSLNWDNVNHKELIDDVLIEKNQFLFDKVNNNEDKEKLIKVLRNTYTNDNADAIEKAREFFPKLNCSYDEYLQVVQTVLSNPITLQKLNFVPSEEQLRCLLSRSRRKLVNSSAGTGKTTIINFMQFLEQNIFKYSDGDILSFTYTRAGAESMDKSYKRICRAFSRNSYLTFTTIHKYCKDLVGYFSSTKRQEIGDDKICVTKTEYFIDEDGYEDYETYEEWLDPFDFQLEAYENSGLSKSNAHKSVIREAFRLLPIISELMITSQEEMDEMLILPKEVPFNFGQLMRLQECYKDVKDRYGLIDFTDMLADAVQILEDIRDGKIQLNAQQLDYITYKSIYLDEAQDTSPLQGYIIDLLLEINPNANFTCIGDTDQAIYSFRGGDVKYMLNFPIKHLHEDLDIIYMTRNRRSALPIIDLSNKVISNNKMRMDRITRGLDNQKTECIIELVKDVSYSAFSLSDQYAYKTIKDAYIRNDDLTRIAVLFREHRQVYMLLNKLLINRIPFNYSASDALCYYNDSQIKTITSFCLYSMNPRDKVYSQDILLYILDNTNQIQNFKNQIWNGKDLLTLLEENETFKSKVNLLKQIIQFGKSNVSVYELALFLSCHGLDIDEATLSIIKEAGDIRIFNWVNKTTSDRKWFSEISNSNSGVTLSTFHSSKGLEWDTVFILPISDEVTPSSHRLNTLPISARKNYTEEERRLLYVAITRAVSRLVIFYDNITSQSNDDTFIKEIKEFKLTSSSLYNIEDIIQEIGK